LKENLKAAGVRTTRSTKNPFTPLVTWALGKKAAAANRSRCASALLYAKKNDKKPDEFIEFLKSEGGIVACAARITERRNKAAGLPTAEAEAEGLIKVCMAHAPKFKIAQSVSLPGGLPEGGVITGLLKIEPRGDCFLLAWHPASTREVLSYGRTKPAVSARRKRP
jgi:hypothetical protein